MLSITLTLFRFSDYRIVCNVRYLNQGNYNFIVAVNYLIHCYFFVVFIRAVLLEIMESHQDVIKDHAADNNGDFSVGHFVLDSILLMGINLLNYTALDLVVMVSFFVKKEIDGFYLRN